jgi:hypothetical protein
MGEERKLASGLSPQKSVKSQDGDVATPGELAPPGAGKVPFRLPIRARTVLKAFKSEHTGRKSGHLLERGRKG